MKDISMHIMDILQNSIRAGAKNITFEFLELNTEDKLVLRFVDDGCGMDKTTAERVLNPFFTTRTTRKVGLGLPLLKQNAERTGGSLTINSEIGTGTEVVAQFGLSNIDLPPKGDLAGAIVLTVSANPDIRFVFHYKSGVIDYTFDTMEVNEALDGVAINDPQIIGYLREMVNENINGTS